MRSRRSLALPFVLVALLGLAHVAARAQEASPAAGEEAMLRVALAELAPGNVSVVGVTRTTYEPGGSLRLVAGGGPTLLFVETGSLTVAADAPPEPLLVAGSPPDAAATPAPLAAGQDHPLDAGSALILPAGGVAVLRNDGAEPAATLDLLAATDAASDAETGITHTLLARHEATLPAPPVEVSLARATIPGGKRLEMPPAPVQTIAATIEHGQTFLLTGQGFNRGTDPVPVYVLSLAPATAAGGTPTP